jgi:hypothetical protein
MRALLRGRIAVWGDEAQVERMVEQGDDREPVGDRADHRRFRRRGDVVQPGTSGLGRPAPPRKPRRRAPAAGREKLHALEFVHCGTHKKKSGQDGCPDPIVKPP